MTSNNTSMNRRWLSTGLAAGVAALLLSACGGGYETLLPTAPASPSGTVPDSATASTRAYTLYAGSLPTTEVGVPLLLTDAVVPTAENEEPLPVN